MEPKTLEKEGKRLAQVILVKRAPEVTLHLVILQEIGSDETVDVGDHTSQATQRQGPGVHKGLAAVFTSSNYHMHGDAERKWTERARGSP